VKISDEISEIKKEKRYLRTLYFVMFLAFGSISPFAAIFYKRILTNPDGSPAIHLIGIIVSSVPIVGFLANIIVGVFADKFGISRKLITILSFFGSFVALLVGFCGTNSIISLAIEQKFMILFFAVLAYSFVTISLNPLVDSQALQFLNKHSDRKKFGSFRIFGTYGWAVAALLTGIILTFSSKYFHENGTNYRLIYYFGALSMLLLGIIGRGAQGNAIKKPHVSYRQIFRDKYFLRFLIFVFLEGIIMTSTDSYLGYFFDDVMKSPLQIGLVYCFWTTFEIPVLAFSGKLLHKFGSRNILISGIIFIVLELFLFSLFELETPFILKFLATLMHGLAFSLHYIGLMDYLDRYSHKDMRTTYLAAMNIAKTTLATVVGGAVGAVIIANFGSQMLMRGGAVGMLFLIIFFLVYVKSPK